MDKLLQDLRYAARLLVTSPGTTLVSVSTIALGIAATTLVFSALNAILFRPLPVADPDELVVVRDVTEGPHMVVMGQTAFSYDRYLAYRDATRAAFAGLAGQRYVDLAVRLGGETQVMTGVLASANYFDVLGIRPGVTRDGKYSSLEEEAEPHVYRAFAQNYVGTLTLHARVRGESGEALAGIRRELSALDPNVALEQPMTLNALLGFFLMPQRAPRAWTP